MTHVLEDRGTHLESRPVRNDGPVRRVPTQANRRTRFEREEVMGMQVIINGEEREVDSTLVSYDDVVAMAGMKGWPSVTFRGAERSGILTPGGEVTLTPGMVFNVCHTGNA